MHGGRSPLDDAGVSTRQTWSLLAVRAQGGFSSTRLDPGAYLIGNEPTCLFQVELRARGVAARLVASEQGVSVEAVTDEVALDGKGLERGSTTALRSGASLHVGGTLLLVQAGRPSVPRRLWPHGSFEMRLEEECLRAEQAQQTFTLVRLRVGAGETPDLGAEILSNQLRLTDVLGVYGPGEYEMLLPDTATAVGRSVVERLAETLRAAGFSVEWGLSSFPVDGLSPDELMAKAGRGVRASNSAGSGNLVIGVDPRLQESIARIAASQLSVLITGETGSGKERTAELIHELSRRSGRPFLKLNCAALSESLLESELFGHERGAFTGAVATKPGLLQTADSGTVFLDEIGELSPSIQAKLLRVIEERQVMRLGGLKPIGIDVRFVSATNRNLEDEIARGTFRIDLYYRIAGAQIWVPPLRERLGELRALTENLIASACEREQRTPLTLSDEALEMMRRYPWPGNVRELRNVIDRAVLLATDGVILPSHLPVEKLLASFAARRAPSHAPPQSQTRSNAKVSVTGTRSLPGATRRDPPTDPSMHTPTPPANSAQGRTPAPKDLKHSIKELERQSIREALDRAAGNQTRAAKALGISRRTLVSRLSALGFPRPRKH